MFSITRRTFLAGTTALAAAGTAPLRALAAPPKTYRALLVACTDYPNLPQKNWLVGPKNDAGLVREYLLKNTPEGVKFADENVTVLASEVDGANGPPTHQAITAALADLAAKAEQGDFVYLHLSGHGAQQPETTPGDETDGLDEIFLPNNIELWKDRSKGVPNALVDNEIGAAIDAIRNKGAFVWAVFDCCHSGTATRAVDVADEFDRKVEFDDLMDDGAREAGRKAMAESQQKAEEAASRALEEDPNTRKPAFNLTPTGGQSIAKGGLVAFYAAQTIETTPEMPLPKGEDDATRFGLFTYTIISKLGENPYATYRQVGQAVLQQYSADGRTRPTPLFEGDLDARVFGTEQIEQGSQWPIAVSGSTATIPAGRLQRLSPGSKLAILEKANFEDSKALGYLEVVSAKNLQSVVKPVAFNDKPEVALSAVPAGAYARVAELAVDYKLAVARPAASDGLDAEVGFVNALLDELNTAKDKHFNVALVEPGESAELRLAVKRENAIPGATADATDQPALLFLPASGDVTGGSRPPLIVIHTDDKEKMLKAVGGNLTTIFRATSLSRLAAASDYRPDEVDVKFRIKRQTDGSMQDLVATSVPRVFPGDEVHVDAKNQSTKLVDINVLYVGSDYSITHIVAERLVSGANLQEGLLAFTDTSFGMERMIAVLTEAPPESEMEDLSFLQQGGLPRETRAVGGPMGFSDMLRDVGLAPSTRSAMKLGGEQGGSKGAVMIFPVETTPRSA